MKGKIVKHNCNDPNCDLTGTVVKTTFRPMRTIGTRKLYFRWILVDWKQAGLKSWIPRKRAEIIK